MNRKEILIVFYRAVMKILGYDPDTFTGTPPVRQTYPQDGAPDWTIDDDVCFLAYTDGEDNTVRPIHTTYEATESGYIRHCRMNRIAEIHFTAYGVHAHENLNLIRRNIYHGNKDLKSAGIALIASDTSVHYAPEFFGGMWWERADLVLRFNTPYTWDEDISSIEEVPVSIRANAPAQSHKIKETDIVIKKG